MSLPCQRDVRLLYWLYICPLDCWKTVERNIVKIEALENMVEN